HGVRIDLLLGEPLWILPEFRTEMLALIKKLSDLPFKGLHLDLEPNQLSSHKYDEAYLLRQLVKTLRAARKMSRVPVGLSIHYRFFESDRSGLCLGCALETVGLEEVTLMIYVSNPIRVAEIAGAILKSYPRLKFSVAQSVEPILAKQESHYTKTKKEFRQMMRQLYANLNHNNFSAIFIQSWQDFERMTP
ncbi:MAG: TolC family protein, partial [Desulfobacterales bacterium]|nr:TolC family protein [Desulfobacterales bacterium]